VTEDGVAAPNVALGLHLYNAGIWTQIMSTTTNADGYYYFTGMNSLCQARSTK